MRKRKVLLWLLLSVAFYIAISPGKSNRTIENLDIPSAFGADIRQAEGEAALLTSAVPVYIYGEQGKIFTMTRDSAGISLTDIREGRQIQSNRVTIVGLEKAIIIGENIALYGLENTLDFFISNPNINDNGQTAVCKGKASDFLKVEVEGFSSIADYIEKMLKNSQYFNFFSDNYKLIDLYVRVGEEGRSLVLPYIEIKNNKPEITGMALFKDSEMVKRIDMDETRIMNMLREDATRGVLYIAQDMKENTDMSAKVKRKVECAKEKGNYSFTINLKIKGDLITNSLFDKLDEDPEIINEFQKALEKKTQESCQTFIKKMQEEYKVDCLELGRTAAAKYGRDTGIDWNEAVSNADIKVNVKVKLDKFGRGRY